MFKRFKKKTMVYYLCGFLFAFIVFVLLAGSRLGYVWVMDKLYDKYSEPSITVITDDADGIDTDTTYTHVTSIEIPKWLTKSVSKQELNQLQTLVELEVIYRLPKEVTIEDFSITFDGEPSYQSEIFLQNISGSEPRERLRKLGQFYRVRDSSLRQNEPRIFEIQPTNMSDMSGSYIMWYEEDGQHLEGGYHVIEYYIDGVTLHEFLRSNIDVSVGFQLPTFRKLYMDSIQNNINVKVNGFDFDSVTLEAPVNP